MATGLKRLHSHERGEIWEAHKNRAEACRVVLSSTGSAVRSERRVSWGNTVLIAMWEFLGNSMRWAGYSFIHLLIHLSIYPKPTHPSIYLPITSSFHPSIHPSSSLHPSSYLLILPFFTLSIQTLSIHLPTYHPFISPSTQTSIHPSITQ